MDGWIIDDWRMDADKFTDTWTREGTNGKCMANLMATVHVVC